VKIQLGDPVISFGQVQLDNCSRRLRELDSVETLLSRAYGFMNLPPLKKPKLLRGDKPRENGLKSNSNDLRNNFVHTIT
jgi:hypothetical protein